MGYFTNNRIITFSELRQIVDNEGNRVYSEELLQKIEEGDFDYLNSIDLFERNNRNFMEPLLYAVKNSKFSTYEIYKYYGDELQKKDLTIATQIVMNEPEIIEDTTIANEASIVLYLVGFNSKITMYISDELKNNGEFIEKLCEVGDKEAVMYVARECNISQVLQDNPNLANNPEFMKETIKNDAEMFKYASDELKNNYEFIKEACANNKEAIKYVSEHTGEFGSESLKGAQEVLKEQFNVQLEKDCNDEVENIKKQIEEKKQQGIEVEPKLEYRVKNLEKRPERIKERIAKIEEGDEKAIRFARKVLKNCDLDDSYREMLEQALKIGEAIAEKQKATEEKASEQINPEITVQDIERTTEDAKLNDVKGEVEVTREEIVEERDGNSQLIKEGIEIND